MLNVKNRKTLIFGLGILGGGIASANWLLKHGARVTITDLKTEKELKKSLSRIRGDATLKLGGHNKADIDDADIIVVNPAVIISKNKYIQYALEKGKTVTNEANIFYENWSKPVIGVTGTRGKTTVVAWINHFLNTQKKSVIAGNNPQHQFLKILDRQKLYDIAVTELASHHLELFTGAPDIAVITNISEDHLDRYGTMENYARIKANIFKNQNPEQTLILNKDDDFTETFLKYRPCGKIVYFSRKHIPKELNLAGFADKYGNHNLDNVIAAAIASHEAGIKWGNIQDAINNLPFVSFRQEIIYQDENLTVINDAASTSPQGGIAALERFGKNNTVLITGGTNANMDYTKWAHRLNENIKNQNVIFLSGSATQEMKHNLGWKSYQEFKTLKECLDKALKISKKIMPCTILFSPASKSFEKFKNEYDRGEKFNKLLRKNLLKQ